MWRFSIILLILAAFLLMGPRAAGAEERPALASLRYLSTGVGLEERAETPAGYQAKLIFASRKGEYFANVQVTLRRGEEKVSIFSEGPWLLIKGEPGRYAVEARAGEATGEGSFTLPKKGQVTVVIRLKRGAPKAMRN